MYYVYVLLSSKDSKFYIGFTPDDPFKRTEKHSLGLVQATKARLPVELIYFEGHANEKDALRRERYFKTTKGKTTLKQMLKENLQLRK
jgi:putative endonuclease